MSQPSSQAPCGIFARVVNARDRFWSGVWWTELMLHRNERLLALALDETGEKSMRVRTLTERHRKLEKGVKYWRPSDPHVIAVLEASERNGVPRSDLRLLALNRDILKVDDQVLIRRGWMSFALTVSAVCVFFISWLMTTSHVVLLPVGLFTKAVGIASVSLIHWFIWPGWGLFTTRAYAAVKRSGDAVEAVARGLVLPKASIKYINRSN